MSGHIGLGVVGALREYMIANTDLYSKSPANQFAAKLATGAGDYDDLQNWSYWVQDNWQLGVGQKDAEGGGFLYGECETRYPEQIFLSRHLHLEMQDSLNVYALDASQVSGERTIGTAETFRKWAVRIGGGSGRVLNNLWIYLKNNGETYTVRLSGETSSAPGTSVTTVTITTDSTTPGYAWYKTSAINQAITSTAYWVSLEVASSGTLPVVSAEHATPNSAKYYNGSAWVATTDYFGILMNSDAYGNDGTVPEISAGTEDLYGGVQIIEFNDILYVTGPTSNLFKRGVIAPGWTAATTNHQASQLLSLGNHLYMALNTTDISTAMDTAEASVTFEVAGVTGNIYHMAQWGGYLWGSDGHQVFYTSVSPPSLATNWTGPITIGMTGETVTGLAGLGDYMYVSTEKELVYVGFGDFVFGVAVYGSPSSENGGKMMHYQGQLFIPVQESLLRYDGSNMLPVGIDLGEGLPPDLQGDVATLTSTNNWLLMGVNPRNTSTKGGTVWAWTTQGWHHIAHLPPGLKISCLYYRRSNQRLYIGTTRGLVFSLYLPDVASVVDTTEPEFAPVGWQETDWFFGGLKEVEKDFESVYISGEDFAAGQYAKVYWKDDASTAWELLGTVTSDRQELRWSDYTTRPSSRQIKIGIELHTNDSAASPLIRAIRIKYHPMVSDWFRWSFPVLCSNNQQELGSTTSTYNANQKRAHLDTLITQIPPFIFRDMDGVQYECKVMGCAIQNDDVEWINGELVFNSIYNMTIEQIRNGVYTG